MTWKKATADTAQLILSARFQGRQRRDNQLFKHSASHKLGGSSAIRTTRSRAKLFGTPTAMASSCGLTKDRSLVIFPCVSLPLIYTFCPSPIQSTLSLCFSVFHPTWRFPSTVACRAEVSSGPLQVTNTQLPARHYYITRWTLSYCDSLPLLVEESVL